MIEILIMTVSIFLLAILVLILPLRLTWQGKGSVFLSSIVISLLWYIGSTIFHLWVILPIVILLAALVTYIVINRVEAFRAETPEYKSLNDYTVPPLFSYQKLVERAEMAETVDHYYTESKQLKENQKSDRADFFAKRKIVGEKLHADHGPEKPINAHSFSRVGLSELDSNDQIDFERRSLEDSYDLQEDTINDDHSDEDEMDLMEIRKRLFANWEERTADHLPFDNEKYKLDDKISPIRDTGIEEGLDPISIEQKDHTTEEKETEDPPYTNREITAAFDDLEELYLQRKSGKKQEEVEK